MKPRRRPARTALLALMIQVGFYLLVVARGCVAPNIPGVRLAAYTAYAGRQPDLRLVSVRESFGGAVFSVSDALQSDAERSPVAAWRLAPAIRATREIDAGAAPMYARWIGITGPAWSGCMQMRPSEPMVIRPTRSAFALPPLVGNWPVFVPHAPSIIWLSADWLFYMGVVLLCGRAWSWWRTRTGHRPDLPRAVVGRWNPGYAY